jgi:nucleoside-diphosphate-sugar epimerase
MNEPILVTGGTGAIGRRVVPLLRAAGRDVRVLSRGGGADEPRVHHFVGDTIDQVAASSGFGSPATLRQCFASAFGATPSGYRRRFDARQ